MNVAIVHYHLRPGGVTRVIEQTARAFAKTPEVNLVVLSGEDYAGHLECQLRVVPGLGYSQSITRLPEPETLAANLMAAARDGLGGGNPDIFHFHNHSLGKNAVLPFALAELLGEGCKCLLQIHDFAEDGRPANYRFLQHHLIQENPTTRARLLYPLGPSIRYAVLNARDASFLTQAGAPRDRVHTLGNPVSTPVESTGTSGLLTPKEESRPFPEAARLILYAVRGIRRKNLGEMVLLASACRSRDWVFATTLPPANPEWKPFYDGWIRFCRQNRLPVAFGVGEDLQFSYESYLQRADALLTTSVAEGFGMAFLEPIAQGKPLIGRDLPEITDDFTDKGLSFPTLYPRLNVPLAWIDSNAFHRKLDIALRDYYVSYGQKFSAEAHERFLKTSIREDQIDFAALDEDLQEQVLVKSLQQPAIAADLLPEFLQNDGFFHPAISELAQRSQILAAHYSLPAFAKKLLQVYQQLLHDPAQPPQDALDPAQLLTLFLRPEAFRFLRT